MSLSPIFMQINLISHDDESHNHLQYQYSIYHIFIFKNKSILLKSVAQKKINHIFSSHIQINKKNRILLVLAVMDQKQKPSYTSRALFDIIDILYIVKK